MAEIRVPRSLSRAGWLTAVFLGTCAASCAVKEEMEIDRRAVARVRWQFQTEPGGRRHEADVPVYPVPENPLAVAADRASLPDDDLVLGVVAGGRARAYPIRFLGLSEIVDDRIGEMPVAASW